MSPVEGAVHAKILPAKSADLKRSYFELQAFILLYPLSLGHHSYHKSSAISYIALSISKFYSMLLKR